jgi:ribosomal protein S18 acetylase RimI-like enzyme
LEFGCAVEEFLKQIESGARVSLLKTLEFAEFGPFCAYFDPLSDLIWLNYAAPVWAIDDSRQVRSAVRDLRAEFGRRVRRLRFEFIQAIWPSLPEMLLREGLILQAEQPLMICTPQTFRLHELPELRIHRLSAGDDDALLATFDRVTQSGFADLGVPNSSDESRRRLRIDLQSDARRGVMGWIGDEPAGVAALSPMGSTAELVGVSTLAKFRRRGVARALSSHLIAEHFAQGREVAWLSANDAIAQGAYRCIGFHDAGVYANYVDPDGATISGKFL